MKRVLIIFGLIISCLACKTQKNTIAAQGLFNRTDNDSLFITISRSNCFGKCPVFEASIYESGHVIYEGKKFVPYIGTYTFYISEDNLKQLKQKAIEINYFHLQTKYDNENVTDLPDCTTSVQLDGVRMKIKNRYQGPVGLEEFEKMIDAIINSVPKGKVALPDERKD